MPAATKKKKAGSPPTMKRGTWGKEEAQKLATLAGKKPLQEIAALLRRSPEAVQRRMTEMGLDDPFAKPMAGTAGLEERPEWAQFREQFDDEELEYLKYRYVQLMAQFGRDDVLPTEEMQIFQLITLELMAMQAMRERRTLVQQQKLVQRQIEETFDALGDMTPDEVDYKETKRLSRDLHAEFADISAQLKAINQRHESFTVRQNKLLGDLKATRDQRVKFVEGSKVSFLGFLKALTQEDYRSTVDRDMELMRVAADRETARMAAPREYVDGATDQPLLTPDTVIGETYGDE